VKSNGDFAWKVGRSIMFIWFNLDFCNIVKAIVA
jgi:hypothetical protein